MISNTQTFYYIQTLTVALVLFLGTAASVAMDTNAATDTPEADTKVLPDQPLTGQTRTVADIQTEIEKLKAKLAKIELQETNPDTCQDGECSDQAQKQQKRSKQQNLSKLLREYSRLLDKQQYEEALRMAQKARELAPDDKNVILMENVARQIYTIHTQHDITPACQLHAQQEIDASFLEYAEQLGIFSLWDIISAMTIRQKEYVYSQIEHFFSQIRNEQIRLEQDLRQGLAPTSSEWDKQMWRR